MKYKDYSYKKSELKIKNNMMYFFGEKTYLKPISFSSIKDIEFISKSFEIRIIGNFKTIYEEVQSIDIMFHSEKSFENAKQILQGLSTKKEKIPNQVNNKIPTKSGKQNDDHTLLDRGEYDFLEPVNVKYQNYNYRESELKIKNNMMYFFGEKAYLKPISFSNIEDIKFFSQNFEIRINGQFETIYEKVQFITIKFYSEDSFKRASQILMCDFSLPASISILKNGEISTKHEALLKINKNNIVVEDHNKRLLTKFNLVSEKYIKNKQTLLIHKTDILYLIEFKHENKLIEDTKRDNETLLTNAGRLYGTIKGESFSDVEVDLLIKNNNIHPPLESITMSLFENMIGNLSIQFIIRDEQSVKLLSPLTIEYTKVNDDYLFHSKTLEILLLRPSKGLKLESYLDSEPFNISTIKDCFGMTLENQPFKIQFNDEHMIFNQAEGINLMLIKTNMIKDIRVTEQKSNMSKICIILQNKDIEFFVCKDKVKELITTCYKEGKQHLVKNASVQTLYSSYSKQMNDFLLYQYFGQLFSIREGLQEIQEKTRNLETKNRELLNFLYYGIQSQKKRLDMVSVYFPSFLYKEDSDNIKDFHSYQVEATYRNLQKSLLSITNQINRHLNEIERSLTPLSFVLIPQKEMDSFIQKKANNGYKTGAAVGALGLIFPPLLLAGGLLAARSYISKKEMEALEKIKEENKQQQLDFFISRALDSFNHFMYTMLPYYIDQVNCSLFNSMKIVNHFYLSSKDSSILEERLLNKLATLYTFKQLPIDDTVLIQKKSLIEEIHNCNSYADQQIDILSDSIKN